jgi:hypothetical protein
MQRVELGATSAHDAILLYSFLLEPNVRSCRTGSASLGRASEIVQASKGTRCIGEFFSMPNTTVRGF